MRCTLIPVSLVTLGLLLIAVYLLFRGALPEGDGTRSALLAGAVTTETADPLVVARANLPARTRSPVIPTATPATPGVEPADENSNAGENSAGFIVRT
ncbi:MAG TPA: hypothetical protein VLE70_01350 [Anaerolineae bacterium]|nr:hypothetical protein [Anaerolineae bacterium]